MAYVRDSWTEAAYEAMQGRGARSVSAQAEAATAAVVRAITDDGGVLPLATAQGTVAPVAIHPTAARSPHGAYIMDATAQHAFLVMPVGAMTVEAQHALQELQKALGCHPSGTAPWYVAQTVCAMPDVKPQDAPGRATEPQDEPQRPRDPLERIGRDASLQRQVDALVGYVRTLRGLVSNLSEQQAEQGKRLEQMTYLWSDANDWPEVEDETHGA